LDHEAHGLARIANELGVEAQVLNAAQTAALEPGIKLDVAGSVYFPIDAHLTPWRFAQTLTALLKEMGVRFQWNTTVFGWRTEAGRIAAVQTTAGDLLADEFILTGGSWSPSMLTGLGLRLQKARAHRLRRAAGATPQERAKPRCSWRKCTRSHVVRGPARGCE
jgi:D-amino-acid dehydrogenase